MALSKPRALSGLPFSTWPLHVAGVQPGTGASAGSASMVPGFHSKTDWPGSGPVYSVSTEARSTESGKIAPEEDVEGQEQDGIDVADGSPERLLGDAGQLPLARSHLLGAPCRLGAAGQPTEPVPQHPAPPPAPGWGPQPGEQGKQKGR